MNAIPAVLDQDVRGTPPRTSTEDVSSSAERTFQDAVDSRRAEHTRSASKEADARSSRSRESEGEESSEEPDAVRVDAPEQRESQASESTVAKGPASAQAQCASRRGAIEPTSIDEGAVPRRTFRVTKNALPDNSTGARAKADPTALANPPFGQTVLEALLDRAVPHGMLPTLSPETSGLLPAGTGMGIAGTHVTAQAAAPGDQPGAASKALNTVPIEAEAIGPILHTTLDSESPTRVVDPHGALAASVAPATSEAAAPAPAPEHLTPAELPALFERLAVHIDTPERSAVVQLDPAELGRISISLSVEPGGHVRAEMHAQRPEGYAALEAQLPQLQASLIERGFTSASMNLSLGLADPHSRRSGAQSEEWKSSSAGRRTLADAEVRALLPASVGAIDMWA